MKLYGFGNSRSFRILWMFKELDVPFNYERLDPKAGDLDDQTFLALNPAGKVPVLVDENLVLTESAAIITYLGDKYPESNLVPKCNTDDRARYNQWCYFALTELEQPLWTMAKHQFALPKKYRVNQMQVTALYEFRQALKILALQLENHHEEGDSWVLGKHFSAADILIGHSLHWAIINKLTINHTAIQTYYENITQRTAFCQAIKIS